MTEININCPCKNTNCHRHGNCIECRKHHKDGQTSCERLVDNKCK